MMHQSIKLSFSFFIFLFLLLILTVPSGLAYGALPLLFFSILILIIDCFRKSVVVDKVDFYVISLLLAFPLIVIVNMQYHHWDWRYFDNPSRFLLVIPIYFVIKKYSLSLSFLYAGLALGAVGAGFLGFQQKWIEGLPTAFGYTHKIPFGDISLMLGALASTYFINEKNSPCRLWLVLIVSLGIAGGLVGSIASGTRGGWIAIPFIGWILISAIVVKKRHQYLIYLALLTLLVGAYMAIPIVNVKVNSAASHVFSYFYESKVYGSAGTRFEMWKAALLIFKDNIFMGIGQNQYGVGLEKLMVAGVVDPKAVWGHAHNEIMTVLAELGLIGLTGLLVLYIGFIRFFITAKKYSLKIATAGFILIIGYIDFGLTQAMFRHIISTTFLTIMLAVFAGYLAHIRSNKDVIDAK